MCEHHIYNWKKSNWKNELVPANLITSNNFEMLSQRWQSVKNKQLIFYIVPHHYYYLGVKYIHNLSVWKIGFIDFLLRIVNPHKFVSMLALLFVKVEVKIQEITF